MKNPNIFILLCFFFIFGVFATGCSDSGSDSKRRTSITVSKNDFDIQGTPLNASLMLAVLEDYDHQSLLTDYIINGDLGRSLVEFIDDAIFMGLGCDFQNEPAFSPDSDGEFRLSFSADYLSCLPNASSPEPGIKLTTLVESLSIRHAIFSQNNNPVGLTGQAWDDIWAYDYQIDKINVKYGFEYTGSENGNSSTLFGKMAIYATDHFENACEFQDTLISNCTIQYIDRISSGTQFDNTVVVSFEYIDVVPAPSGTLSNGFDPVYFASGTVNFKVNNWTGTLIYSAPDVAPTYSATDGVETVEGNLSL